MAKKRIIDSRIRKSLSFSALTYRQRDLWHGLITVADDQGRTLALPAIVRSEVWPYDEINVSEVQEDLSALVDQGMIYIYQVKNKPVLQVVNWWRYQVKQWAGPSDWDPPEGWEDRKRYHGPGHKIILENWDRPGGFGPGYAYANQVENHLENHLENHAGLNDSDSDSDIEEDPKGPASGTSVPTPANLDDWLELLQQEKNKNAALKKMIEVLHPSLVEFPDFGYIGKTAKKVGGAGRLAVLIWETAAKNVTGDLLAYIMAMTNGRTKDQEPAGFKSLKAYANSQGWNNGD